MSQAEPKPSVRLWEYLWYPVATLAVLAAGLLLVVIELVARLAGAKRK